MKHTPSGCWGGGGGSVFVCLPPVPRTSSPVSWMMPVSAWASHTGDPRRPCELYSAWNPPSLGGDASY